jgi:hypothetical protein
MLSRSPLLWGLTTFALAASEPVLAAERNFARSWILDLALRKVRVNAYARRHFHARLA